MSAQRFSTRFGRSIAWLFFAPGGWIAIALLLVGLFAVAHALGWRTHTSIFSGTLPAPTAGASGEILALLGLVYAMLYFVASLIAPVLVIAAGMRWAAQWLVERIPARNHS